MAARLLMTVLEAIQYHPTACCWSKASHKDSSDSRGRDYTKAQILGDVEVCVTLKKKLFEVFIDCL